MTQALTVVQAKESTRGQHQTSASKLQFPSTDKIFGEYPLSFPPHCSVVDFIFNLNLIIFVSQRSGFCSRFVVDSPAELEELLESLHPQGVRESELKLKIQNR